MTAKWRDKSQPQAGFMAWLRSNTSLDSTAQGLVAVDVDAWIHKYKTAGDRRYQFVMLVEIKEHGAQPNPFQRDTLHIINQLLRNRRNTKEQWNAAGSHPRIAKCYSIMNKGTVHVLGYGAHLLQFSGDGSNPERSLILWDRKPISVTQLEQLLRFELDPDTLRKIDHRPHQRHKRHEFLRSEQTELGFTVERKIVFSS